MGTDKPESVFSKFWNWLSHFGNLQTLFGLFTTFGVSSYVTSMLPGGWHPPQYWAVFGTVLFGTGFVVALVVQGARAAYELLNPPTLNFIPHGGGDASIDLWPSVSGDYYGTIWLLDVERRQKPFQVSWHAYSSEHKHIRGGDHTPFRLALLNTEKRTMEIYGLEGVVHSLSYADDIQKNQSKWNEGYLVQDQRWFEVRIEMRAKQHAETWTRRFRFRLNRHIGFDIEPVQS
jgi:hypothetical protein